MNDAFKGRVPSPNIGPFKTVYQFGLPPLQNASFWTFWRHISQISTTKR